MRQQTSSIATMARIALLAAFVISCGLQNATAQQLASPPAQPPSAQPVARPVDPRVQIREYLFEDTKEQMPYALFVSSKVSSTKKSPLIVTLHGLGGTHTTMMRANALDLAEAGGYILVSPMGYNPRGWYGSPPFGPPPGARAPNGSPPPGARPPGAPPQGATRPRPGALGPDPNDPPNLRELSEKDVMNVLAMMQKELNVDPDRIYLMGHSMGGAGALHLAVKYPDKWAAVAAIAPAAFGLDPASLTKIPSMPVAFVHGDLDDIVPVSISRTWVDVLKTNKMTYEYKEVAGGDHGNVITLGQPDIFAFFDKHSKNGVKSAAGN